MPTLTLRRSKSWLDFGRWRTLFVQVGDGTLVPLIPMRSGERKEIELPPGSHTLVAGMDYWRSAPLDVTLGEGEAKAVFVRSRPFVAWLGVSPFSSFQLEETAGWSSEPSR